MTIAELVDRFSRPRVEAAIRDLQPPDGRHCSTPVKSLPLIHRVVAVELAAITGPGVVAFHQLSSESAIRIHPDYTLP
jgi:hypothetical protein